MAERGANGPQPSSLSVDACEDLNDGTAPYWNLNHDSEPAMPPPADDEPSAAVAAPMDGTTEDALAAAVAGELADQDIFAGLLDGLNSNTSDDGGVDWKAVLYHTATDEDGEQ